MPSPFAILQATCAAALRAGVAVALLFTVLVGGLPRGTLLSLTPGGEVGIQMSGCCAVSAVATTAVDRAVRCCCFTGVLIGHPDQLAAPQAVGFDAPPAAPAELRNWASCIASDAPSVGRSLPSRRVDRGPPPPLGLLRPETIVIRC